MVFPALPGIEKPRQEKEDPPAEAEIEPSAQATDLWLGRLVVGWNSWERETGVGIASTTQVKENTKDQKG